MPLSHIDAEGRVLMVDVGSKAPSSREATASGEIRMSPEAFAAISQDRLKKGSALATARVAAIMAAKRTSDTIPLCHPLQLSAVTVDFKAQAERSSIEATVTVKVDGKTGVEMEAMHAVSVALLTIYDMAKAVDKAMVIDGIRLLKKTGGKSGAFVRED